MNLSDSFISPEVRPSIALLYEKLCSTIPIGIDDDAFLRAWRLRLNLAQTMIVKGDRVRYIRLGNLMAKDMRGIINTLREGEEK